MSARQVFPFGPAIMAEQNPLFATRPTSNGEDTCGPGGETSQADHVSDVAVARHSGTSSRSGGAGPTMTTEPGIDSGAGGRALAGPPAPFSLKGTLGAPEVLRSQYAHPRQRQKPICIACKRRHRGGCKVRRRTIAEMREYRRTHPVTMRTLREEGRLA